MANQEHIDLLVRGGEPLKSKFLFSQSLDLSGANLVNIKLPGVSLYEPNMEGAKLAGADLTNAHLIGAKLKGANLDGAHLRGAILTGSDLTKASLTSADLAEANLNSANFYQANLAEAHLENTTCEKANLSEANCPYAHLTKAQLPKAKLRCAYLYRADLTLANLSEANLQGANLLEANLTKATLTDTDLSLATLVSSILDGAKLANNSVYGVAAWDIRLDAETKQSRLRLSRPEDPAITVDDLEIAQFVYLILNNQKIRQVIDTITSKVVLILGRFTPDRKAILNVLREALKARNYSPVIFDFEKPASRNLTETVSTLAHMARFVIADITDAKSIPQELQRIVPDLPSVPVQPVLHSSFTEYAMFRDFFDYPTVLTPHRYDRIEELLASLDEKVIAPAVNRAKEIEEKRKAFEMAIIK